MGYYIRIFAERDVEIPVLDLRRVLLQGNLDSRIIVGRGDELSWLELSLQHGDGTAISLVEKNPILPETLGTEELEEFLEELETTQPRSAAHWLMKRLRNVKAIYAFQVLSGADANRGWDAIHGLFSEIRDRSNGFSQADAEGFSNHQGSQITWNFNDNVDGEWQMAVLDSHGDWETFRMNLGEPAHRASFLNGEVPLGVQRI